MQVLLVLLTLIIAWTIIKIALRYISHKANPTFANSSFDSMPTVSKFELNESSSGK